MQDFPKQLQAQLSQKQKSFFGFFMVFLRGTSSLVNFEKKMILHVEVLTKLFAPKIVDTQMSERPYIRTRFGKQSVSVYEILLKSSRHNYYPMFP